MCVSMWRIKILVELVTWHSVTHYQHCDSLMVNMFFIPTKLSIKSAIIMQLFLFYDRNEMTDRREGRIQAHTFWHYAEVYSRFQRTA